MVLSLLSLQAQLFLHLPFQTEDETTALLTGLSAAEKADTHEEDELQAAEEVCGPSGPWGFCLNRLVRNFNSIPSFPQWPAAPHSLLAYTLSSFHLSLLMKLTLK